MLMHVKSCTLRTSIHQSNEMAASIKDYTLFTKTLLLSHDKSYLQP